MRRGYSLELETPKGRDDVPVDYALVLDDASLTPVSSHGDILTGIAAAGYAVEVEDFDFAYAPYAGDRGYKPTSSD